MKKLIINNKSDLADTEAIMLISRVVGMGKISNDGNQYCYMTAFTVYGKGYAVYSMLNKASDRLIIVNDNNVSDEAF